MISIFSLSSPGSLEQHLPCWRFADIKMTPLNNQVYVANFASTFYSTYGFQQLQHGHASIRQAFSKGLDVL